MDALTVKTSVFEGPLDLLLELIESRKLLINDISLATVTDEYIARVNSMDGLPLGETAEFIALAATLLLIKSRSLLPTLSLTDEEERDIKELEFRLAVYQIVKESAKGLRGALGNAPLWDGTPVEPDPVFAPDQKATLPAMREALKRLLEEFPQPAALPKIAVKKVISLEEMIENLGRRINAAMKLSFKEFSGHGKGQAEKATVIVTFLALLELVKQGTIRAEQEGQYGDITLESDQIGTPSYE